MRHACALVALLTLLTAVSCEQRHSSPVPEAVVSDARSAFAIAADLPLYSLSNGTLTQRETITIGEKLALLGQTEKVTQAGKDRELLHVRRASGNDGWVRSDFLVSRSILAVTTDDAVIYSVPNNTAATTAIVPRLTVLAIHADTGGMSFIRVTGFDASAKMLIKDVYLRNEGVSSKEEDVEPAILLKLAAASHNQKQRQAFLSSAIKDFPGSIFLPDVKAALDELTAPPTPAAPAPAASTPAAPAQQGAASTAPAAPAQPEVTSPAAVPPAPTTP
jgi:hypothetical protein